MNFFARVRHITRPLSNLETGVISQKKFSSRAFASQLPRNFLLHADRKRLPPTTSESWWRHALYYLRFNARNFNNIILSCVQLRVTRIPFRIIASPSPPHFSFLFVILLYLRNPVSIFRGKIRGRISSFKLYTFVI